MPARLVGGSGTYQGPRLPFIKGGGLVGPAAYLGQVATNCFIPTATSSSNKQIMSRSAHYARDTLTSVQVVIANWYWGNPSEKTLGAAASITGSIEYPAGTFTQLKFGGAVTGTAADGTNLVSDAATVSIPNGTLFWVRVWFSNPNGILYFTHTGSTNNALNTGLNEWIVYGSTTPDLTMSGSQAGGTGQPNGFRPVAIIAQTKKPSVLLIGDSRVRGTNDTPDTSNDLGELARSIGASLAYINTGSHGDFVSQFISSHAYRVGLKQYVTHVICEAGINDITGGGATASSLEANLQTVWSYFSDKKVYNITIPPVTSSTDSWATTANQTSSGNAVRVAVNNYVRSTPAPLAGYFEIADQVESARDSGLWKANGTASQYTADGTHETQFAYLAEQSSSAINPAFLTR